ncbi:hypothetical protein KCTC32516_00016 [Polaribacter huanghezhanensis]|uniref:DUF1456 family protein n=1 Tax=Polaribacter huanghezhanensis TaxID=1354726 RepID=UPI00264A10D9|nr:DUF1456 family protein [Polaribacter huanghezhanensis]WKD84682.1 hypothetical protein KCTC32516_00016 [Polaribacter huanghezhanensis]
MGLTNNDIFKKLRVAHKLRDTDIIDICKLVDFKVSKGELGAFFRNEEHPKYMECGDQILRNFLNGLIIHLRGPMPAKGEKPQLKNKPNDSKKAF